MKFYDIPESSYNDIEKFRGVIQQFKSGEKSPVEFRAARVPFGIYEQRTDGQYMVRIRCAAGGISPAQLNRVAELARDYGSGRIHVTTRQEVQIHDVILENLMPVLAGLLDAGLSTRGGGGNTVRNITASVGSGIDIDEVFDVTPHAIALTSRLIAEPDSWNLPRKLKIAFSNSSSDTARASVHDLGFVASRENGERGFRVYIAGGLGAKPHTARLLHAFIPEDRVYAVARAVKSLFDKQGNRRNKHAARLRFVWQRLGADEFVRLYERELNAVLSAADYTPLSIQAVDNASVDTGREEIVAVSSDHTVWHRRYVSPQRQQGLVGITVPLSLGDISANDALALSRLAARFGDNVLRFSPQQNIHLRNIPEGQASAVYADLALLSSLAQYPAIAGAITACTGAGTCRLGICLSRGVARAIYQKMYDSNLPLDELGEIAINISGCPNACGQHPIAQLGFYGRVGRQGGRSYPAYVVLAGGRTGADGALFAEPIGEVSARDLPDLVLDALGAYRERKALYRTFNDFYDAEGKQALVALCERYKNVPAFETDKNYYFDWDSSELFTAVRLGKAECSAGLFDMIDHDVDQIHRYRAAAEHSDSREAFSAALERLVFHAARMLLVTKGREAKNDSEALAIFKKEFIDAGLISPEFAGLIEAAELQNFGALADQYGAVYRLADAVIDLYRRMDDSLRFPDHKAAEQTLSGPTEKRAAAADVFRDYRGVPCPMNFVKVKLDLESMQSGQVLEIYLDDGDPVANVPKSVQEEGHTVLNINRDARHWSVLIKKG